MNDYPQFVRSLVRPGCDLNELAKFVRQSNEKWWIDINTGKPIERNKGELLMLVVTELAEAVEGIRKNLMDDKLPHRKMEEVEMADAFIRLMDFAGGFSIDLGISAGCLQYRKNKSEYILGICSCVSGVSGCRGQLEAECVVFSINSIEYYCDVHGLDLWGAIAEKLIYNHTRQDHTHEARRAAGGKAF